MVPYTFYRGRFLRIALGITMVALLLAGEVEAAQFFNISGTKYNGSGISLGNVMTMTTGQTWSPGAGYELTINAVDARTTPRQVWFTLKKNGAILENSIGNAGQTYNYNNLFFTKIYSIFSGATSDMVQFTETFLVENTAEPLPGWKIYLRNSTTGIEIANTTTGVNGFYKFTGLLPGVYNVSEEMKGGWVNVAPLFQIVTISTGNISNLNFTNMKLIPRFNISGFMINDSNSNGVWDAGEGGIPGWNITLNSSTGAFISSTLTGANGFYQFTNIAQGNYNLTEVMQAGWNNTNSKFKLIALDKDLSNLNFTNKNVMVVRYFNISGTKYNGSGISLGLMTLSIGQTWDMGAGWTLTANSIDARASPRLVWFTLSKNGVHIDDKVVEEGQTYNYNNLFFTKINRIFAGATSDMVKVTETFRVENTAEPLPGWKIYLRNSTTGIEIANTTTGLNGSYNFTGLLPGLYNVSEEMKGGWVNVAPLFQIVTISTSNITNLNFTNQKLTNDPVDLPPVAICGPDKLKCENAGTKVQFNGNASYDPDGNISSYGWEFGDGTNGTGVAPNHTYAAYRWNGTAYQSFIVNLTITDNVGSTNRTSQKMVIWMAGDANGDGKVNILDASVVGLKWNGNDQCADLNNDGVVNILDASIIGLNWGKIP